MFEGQLPLNPALALRQIPEYIIVLNVRDEIVFFTDEAQRIHRQLGASLELGACFPDTAVVTTTKKLYTDIIKQIKETKTPVTTDATVNDVEKNILLSFEVSYIPVLDAHGEVAQISIIAREITPQKIYEKKTNQLIHEISLLIEDANAFVFGVDSLGYITEWNKESVRLTKFEKADVFTKIMAELVDESSLDVFKNLMASSLRGELTSNHEIHIKTKEGMVTALLSATPKKNSLGHVVGALFVGQDISELVNYRKSLEDKVRERTISLKKALQKEQELVDLKNRFVSIASHEFKIPLAAMGTSTNSIKSNHRLTKSVMKHIDHIEKQIGIMRSLLDDVLTLERGNSNKVKASLQNMDIKAFLEKISEEIVAATGQTHRVISNFSHTEILIDSDEKLLRNIFSNVLSNAIKFSPQKREIQLEVVQERSQIIIVIRDQGIGIQQEDLQRVFQPFNRGSNVSDIKGTGLGLSIAKRAIEALDGTLDIESEIDKGTTITIRFNRI